MTYSIIGSGAIGTALARQFARNEMQVINTTTKGANPRPVRIYVIEVSFDNLQDETEMAYFENLPTAFNLPPGGVARLRAVAGKLLNQSAPYRALLRDLGRDSNATN